ncbi:hypothetical protein BDK51DRAFT_45531 [Blyttiomyces helicus]|uniref:Uncharacterized protein n=1 Tax=Blyttiomyces helicus TaxID=388810 RepID=A0A4P9VX98_9FUNG|nr:hypothetical protein BDK51DRAFT_45531 [Blyttiomyces helicus]|eukprot:RKO82908.1 hypothetical protein BDK51DRAFT_45531 [Blyttiomyces helicus]
MSIQYIPLLVSIASDTGGIPKSSILAAASFLLGLTEIMEMFDTRLWTSQSLRPLLAAQSLEPVPERKVNDRRGSSPDVETGLKGVWRLPPVKITVLNGTEHLPNGGTSHPIATSLRTFLDAIGYLGDESSPLVVRIFVIDSAESRDAIYDRFMSSELQTTQCVFIGPSNSGSFIFDGKTDAGRWFQGILVMMADATHDDLAAQVLLSAGLRVKDILLAYSGSGASAGHGPRVVTRIGSSRNLLHDVQKELGHDVRAAVGRRPPRRAGKRVQLGASRARRFPPFPARPAGVGRGRSVAPPVCGQGAVPPHLITPVIAGGLLQGGNVDGYTKSDSRNESELDEVD